MGLLDSFKRAASADQGKATQAAAAPDAVAAARTRARRRLIGATVLLAAGVIGFPLLFETQPRPVPVNIPIEIPARDKLPPLVLAPATAASADPAAGPAPATAGAASAAPTDQAAAPAAGIVTERAADQGREVPPRAAEPVAPAPADKQLADTKPVDAKAAEAKPAEAKPADAKPAAKPRDDDGARARALLEGRAAPSPAPAADGGRVVVQVGAYTEADKLREVRARVEKLGLSTYTQVVEIKGTRHTRVRVGPFGSRAEADKAAARIKAAGLPVAVLSL